MAVDKQDNLKKSLRDRQDQREKLIRWVSYIAGGFLGIMIIFAVLGQYFGFLGWLGLDWMVNRQGGIYADCSKAENIHNPYCAPKQSSADREWDKMRGGGKSVPFTLHDN